MKTQYKQLLSPHFKLYEFIRSGTAIENDIDNTPDDKQIAALTDLCCNILEPLRTMFGPIVISSGYRCQKLNRLVNGVPSSQHMKGEAADIVIGTAERAQRMHDFIVRKLDFDQLIMEPVHSPTPRWLHVSYTKRHRNRHQVIS